MTTELIWTVLPNGRAGGRVRATLYVSPRLAGSAVLGDFALVRDWPAQLVDAEGNWKAEFRIWFSGGRAPTRATPVVETSGPRKTYRPDPALWSALLPADTTVRNYQFKDLSQRRVHSFPTRNIKSFIDQQYRGTAVSSPTEPPRTEQLLSEPRLRDISLFRPIQLDVHEQATLFAPGGEVRDYTKLAKTESARIGRTVTANELLVADMRRHVDAETDALFTDARVGKLRALPPQPPNARNDFMQLKRFHLPRQRRPLDTKVEAPKMDFHQLVTAYGQHPALLRLLGLAIDVEIEAVPPGGTGLVWVQVEPQSLQTKAMRTHFQYRPDGEAALGFAVRPEKDSDVAGCCLAVGKSAFSVLHMDVNGAGEKAMSLAVDVQRASILRSADTKERTALPALQTAGISLVRTGGALFAANRFAAQRALNDRLMAKQEVELWADDLLRGYRVDVLDGTSGHWRSLCRRKVTYSRLDNGQSWFEDYQGNDGWVSAAVTESTEDDDDDLYLQESLFRWNGWSLVAPRPGNTLGTDYKSVKQESEAAQPLNLRLATEPSKGSLPRLRYGFPYKLRARAVDLAGNSLTLDEADRLTESEMAAQLVLGQGYVYRRLEPVAQPVVLAHDPLNDSNGESVERLVIRSYNHKPELDSTPTPETTQRHILPTGTSQLMAEAHGQFDDAAGHPQPAAYNAIIGHDNPLPNKDGVYRQPNVPIPYLPDPAGRGAAFTGLPTRGAPDNRVNVYLGNGQTQSWRIDPPPKPDTVVHQVDFGPPDAWPDLKSFRLRVAGTQEARDPVWDAARREFIVFLRPAEMRKVRLSSYLLEKDLEKFETWGWLKEEKQDAALKGRVLAGLHWMLTPFRELTLVHAVQQPLVTPEFRALRAHRGRGETAATLIDTFPIDGRSTLKLDVGAEWRDVSDSGERPVWFTGRAHAFEFPLEYVDTQAEFKPEKTITRYMVNPRNLGIIKSDVLERMRAPILRQPAPATKVAPEDSRHAVKPMRGMTPKDAPSAADSAKLLRGQPRTEAARIAPEIARVAPLQALRKPVVERAASRHEFGDTRYRRVTYTATATTRFLEYMSFYQSFQAFQQTHRAGAPAEGQPKGDAVSSWEQQNPRQGFRRRSQPVTIDVLSSARPPAPEIEYVIPTFGWQRSAEGERVSSNRSGGGLRVYLKRPWFASGAGELLGVVVGQPAGRLRQSGRAPAVGMDALAPYITQWGMDPVWRSVPTPTSWTPGLQNFRNAVATESNLTLDELPGARVSVAGYVVGWWDEAGNLTGYDEQRQLWYCDIELDPGQSYYPFVRLALTRYQPNSISWQGADPGDVKLSRVVLADFAQLTPDRFASVTFASAVTLNVGVTGYTYFESGADKYAPDVDLARPQMRSVEPRGNQATLQRRSDDPGLLTRITRPMFPREKGGSTVEVSLETSSAGGSEPLAWQPVPDSTVRLARVPAKNGWFGQVTLPEPRGSRRFRLAIREYEWFVADGTDDEPRTIKRVPTASRLVYADVLEI